MSYEPGIADESVRSVITEESSQRMIQFATNHLETKQPQDITLNFWSLQFCFLKESHLAV